MQVMNTWVKGILLCTVVEYCQILGKLVLKGFYFMLSCPSMFMSQGGQMFVEFNLWHIKSPFCNWEHRGWKCCSWLKNFPRWSLNLGISHLQLQVLKSLLFWDAILLMCIYYFWPQQVRVFIVLFYFILRHTVKSIKGRKFLVFLRYLTFLNKAGLLN